MVQFFKHRQKLKINRSFLTRQKEAIYMSQAVREALEKLRQGLIVAKVLGTLAEKRKK